MLRPGACCLESGARAQTAMSSSRSRLSSAGGNPAEVMWEIGRGGDSPPVPDPCPAPPPLAASRSARFLRMRSTSLMPDDFCLSGPEGGPAGELNACRTGGLGADSRFMSDMDTVSLPRLLNVGASAARRRSLPLAAFGRRSLFLAALARLFRRRRRTQQTMHSTHRQQSSSPPPPPTAMARMPVKLRKADASGGRSGGGTAGSGGLGGTSETTPAVVDARPISTAPTPVVSLISAGVTRLLRRASTLAASAAVSLVTVVETL